MELLRSIKGGDIILSYMDAQTLKDLGRVSCSYRDLKRWIEAWIKSLQKALLLE